LVHGTRDCLKSEAVAANAALCCADAKRLPFRDGSFDLVIFVYTGSITFAVISGAA
jgi:ubiquinone/menaquinone biosynthesis C-methylase UbiE